MSKSASERSTDRKALWTRTTAIALFAAIASSSLSASAAGVQMVNDEPQELTLEASIRFDGPPIFLPLEPEAQQGVLMLPARAVLEWLGYEVLWNQQNYAVTATHSNGSRLIFTIGRPETEVEGRTYSNPASPVPYLKEDLSFIPIDFITELQGVELSRDPIKAQFVIRSLDTEEVTEIRVATRSLDPAAPVPVKLIDYMREEWGVEPKITPIQKEHYRERINLLLASGDLHDLMLLQSPYHLSDDIIASVFLDLTDYLTEYPNLEAWIDQRAFPSGMRINGGIYGIPLPIDEHDAIFPVIRQDWLDMLGFANPQTMEQLYEALLTIQASDPEGDGKHNTVGITGYTHGNSLGTLAWVEHIYTGSASRFHIQEGQVVDTVVSDGQVKALEWLANAYQDRILDPEFAVMTKDQVEALNEYGHVILTAMTPDEAARETLQWQEAGRPDMWVPLAGLKAGEATSALVPTNTSSAMVYAVPANLTDRKVRAVLDWLDKGLNNSLEQWRAASITEEELEFVLQWFGREDLLVEPIFYSDRLQEPARTHFVNAATEWQSAEIQIQGLPQADRLFSRGEYAQLNEQINRKKIEVIMGKLTLEDWRQFISELQENPEYLEMMAYLSELFE